MKITISHSQIPRKVISKDLSTISAQTEMLGTQAFLRGKAELDYPLTLAPSDEDTYTRLLGNDFILGYTDQLTSALRNPYFEQVAWTELIGINRRNAYRVMARLPWFLQMPFPVDGYPNVILSEEELKQFNRFFRGTSLLLLSWNIGLGATKIEDEFEWCRPYALLSQARFDMIQRMIVLGKIEELGLPLPKPGFAWLLAECAHCLHCISGYEVVEGSRAVRSAYQSYENGKEMLKALKAGRYSHKASTIKEVILNFNSIIDAKAEELSKTDKSFKKQHFNGYLELRTGWNRKTKDLKPLRKHPPGRRPGQRNPKKDETIARRKYYEI